MKHLWMQLVRIGISGRGDVRDSRHVSFLNTLVLLVLSLIVQNIVVSAYFHPATLPVTLAFVAHLLFIGATLAWNRAGQYLIGRVWFGLSAALFLSLYSVMMGPASYWEFFLVLCVYVQFFIFPKSEHRWMAFVVLIFGLCFLGVHFLVPAHGLLPDIPPAFARAVAVFNIVGILVGSVCMGVVGYVVVHRSERDLLVEHERSEQAFRELDRAKSEFFANVSHEFRTPLTLTLGPLDDVLAGDYGPVPEPILEPVGLARRSAARVLGLINQILDLSRLEAGSAPFRARPVDLVAFVGAQVDAFAPLATHCRITVAFAPPDTPVDVWLDPEAAGAILTNLLSNALKFTPEGGAVRLGVDVEGAEARVTVRDSGPGIVADDLPHIFDRFYRASSEGGESVGSGIGLALARQLVTLHGGTLTAESEIGFGSTFTLTLPLGRDHLHPDQLDERPWTPSPPSVPKDADARPEADPEADPAGEDHDRTTVLVADDHADIRAYLRRHLEGAGYRVVEASDGEAALESVRQRLPDLVVSDVMMPRLDGLGLCRALRADPETDFVPVLLLTAKAASEDRLEGLAELCDDYLTKPFDVRELVARVENLISLRRRLRERFAVLGWPTGDGVSGDGRPGVIDVAFTPAPSPVQSADETFVATVYDAIWENLADESFGVGALAEAVGLSRSHLLRRTTELLDAPPSELIRSARLDQAARLLVARAGTVSEIAYAVGFKSVAHFSDAFLAHSGVRPSAYTREQASG